MSIQNKSLVLTIALIGALATAGCGKKEEKAPAPGEPKSEAQTAPTTIGTEIDDTAITTKVKTALLADDYVKGLDIKVETRKGEVQLSGYVDSQEQIDKAVAIAKGIEGVKNVDNEMMVKGGEASVGEKIDDTIITTKVKAGLAGDDSIKNSTDIAVETQEGEVQLSGHANDQAQMDRAVEIARGVEGVKNVVNKMSIKE
ncbi:BON domain-containing protein [Nitrosospira multiformis]|uniref:Osmotically-inducible protein Y n=1 Tax=Nitrosospira multiformis TaxID=1231 RepID=A0A1I7GN72_9PROT|nr:BON domain-containing protein [Nitrosospira multiformis]SFU49913.1 hyperosmotically inducible protein [Nitrosospira multiformis]